MLSRSMIPLILPKDKPIIEKSDFFGVNDIVAFQKRGEIIAHRIIYVSPKKDFYITKGDANYHSDGKIKENQILGVVNKIKRGRDEIVLSHVYLAQSLNYFKNISPVIGRFDSAKMVYIILKGLPLHFLYTGKVPGRLYTDIDILVKEEDFEKTAKILKDEGFLPMKSRFFGHTVRHPSQISFVKDVKPIGIEIDLHTKVTPGFAKARVLNKLIPSQEALNTYLFKNTEKIKIEGISFPVLKKEALVLFLLLHLFRHNFKGPQRYELLDTIIRNQKINWNKILAELSFLGLSSFVYPSVFLLSNLYKTPIPKKVARKISPKPLKKLLIHILLGGVDPFSRSSRAREGIQKFVFTLVLSPAPLKHKVKTIFSKETLGHALGVVNYLLSE